jgi:hypothetical protein
MAVPPLVPPARLRPQGHYPRRGSLGIVEAFTTPCAACTRGTRDVHPRDATRPKRHRGVGISPLRGLGEDDHVDDIIALGSAEAQPDFPRAARSISEFIRRLSARSSSSSRTLRTTSRSSAASIAPSSPLISLWLGRSPRRRSDRRTHGMGLGGVGEEVALVARARAGNR